MRTLDKFYAFKFIRILTQDWKDTKAYEHGIIDEKGNALKKFRELRSSEEKKAYSRFVRLVFNIKRMLEKVPFGASTIARYSAAVMLLREHNLDEVFLDYLEENYDMDNIQEDIWQDLKKRRFTTRDIKKVNPKWQTLVVVDMDMSLETIKEKERVKEFKIDISVSPFDRRDYIISWREDHKLETDRNYIDSASGLAEAKKIALQAAQYFIKYKRPPTMHSDLYENFTTGVDMADNSLSKPREKFAGAEIFDVDGDMLLKSKDGKKKYARFKTYVGEDDLGQEIKKYCYKNPKKDVILRDNTGSMVYFKRRR